MFKRIIHEQWTMVVPIISFILTAAVFLIFTIRALIMRKSDTTHLSSLPLTEPGTPTLKSHER
jgi:hypothetical protein